MEREICLENIEEGRVLMQEVLYNFDKPNYIIDIINRKVTDK